MKIYLLWREKSDPYSEDGDYLVGVYLNEKHAKNKVSHDYFYVTEEETRD